MITDSLRKLVVWNSMFVAVTVSAVNAAPETDIDFFDSIDEARLLDAVESKPLLVQFGATWCGWCRRIESQTLTDKAVKELALAFTCVKIDIDEQSEVAATYGVRAVPRTIVMDRQGRVIVSHAGFLPPAQMIEFMNGALEAYRAAREGATSHAQTAAATQPDDATTTQPEQPSTRPAKPDFRTSVTNMVELLARPQRAGRDRILATLAKTGSKAWPVLVDLLEDDRIAIRAAAAHALKEITRAPLSFDPFANVDARKQQAAAWRSWTNEHAPAESPLPVSLGAPRSRGFDFHGAFLTSRHRSGAEDAHRLRRAWLVLPLPVH
jgi:thioredoxin-like negative regulator of GroEL